MKGQIEKDSIAGQLKAAGVSDNDRVYYMLHGYYPIEDSSCNTLRPNDNVLYATNNKLKRAVVTGATWQVAKATVGATGSQQCPSTLERSSQQTEAPKGRFRLTILTNHGRTMYIDPKRCVKV